MYCKSCTGPEHSTAVRRKLNFGVVSDKEAIFCFVLLGFFGFFFVMETSCIFEIREPISIFEESCVSLSLKEEKVLKS